MTENPISRFKLLTKIGRGSFGKIYSAWDREIDKKVAIKIEKSERNGSLHKEVIFYKILNEEEGVPQMIYYNLDSDQNILVLELLGSSIEELFISCNRKFSLKTTLMISFQVIERVKQVHKKGIIHRDIKPHNFLMGVKENKDFVYIVDFGLSKKYMHKNGKHIKFRENSSLVGTVRYASHYNQLGIVQSRRDDLISLGYLLIYLIKGKLPWQGLHSDGKWTRNQKILQCKLDTSISKLCKGLPNEFKTFMEYTTQLDFDENPDYHMLKKNFKTLFNKMGLVNDYEYDWKLLSRDPQFI